MLPSFLDHGESDRLITSGRYMHGSGANVFPSMWPV